MALGAQGLIGDRPTGLVSARQVGRTFDRIQLLQIDSVNVLQRSHYLPLFSRLGPYDRGIPDRLASRAPRRMVEYWAHEACFVRPALLPDLRQWQRRTWMNAAALDPALREDLSQRIMACLSHSRPLTARQVSERIGHIGIRSRDEWGWNWSAVKRVLEDLFAEGVLSAASRTEQFERRYAPLTKVIPPSPSGFPDDGPDAALLRLCAAAARAHGIGTVRCFADYFRTPVKQTAEAVRVLVADGVLEPVEVRGWDRLVFRHRDATVPRTARSRALLSPFDSLVFERRRLQELFGFYYRLEIYTPAPKRKYGYYVLPFLLGERLVARVDLKADRAEGRLLVRSAHAELGAPQDTAVELRAELALLAQWLELSRIVVEPHGDLAPALAHHGT